MFASHLSDKLLVRYLDGECSRLQARFARRHLAACWSCRARLAEFDEQMEEMVKAISNQGFPGPEWSANGLIKLEERRREVERVSRPPRRIERSAFALRALAGAALVVLCVGLAIQFRSRSQPRMADAATLLARAEAAESKIGQEPIHQQFRVELSQTKPERRQTTVVDLWSDPERQRFTSRWRQPDGVLRYAVWNAGSGKAYVYAAAKGSELRASSPPRASVAFSALLADAATDDVEAFFMRWLTSRGWRPISLAGDLAWFLRQDGAVLGLERISQPDRTRMLLSAIRELNGVRAVMTLEIDAATFRPSIQTLSIQTPERALNVRITAEKFEVVETPRMLASVFEPDVPNASRTLSPTPLPDRPLAPGAPVKPVRVLSSTESETLELDVHQALHRARACLGDQVSVSRGPRGTISVSGLVETESRRQTLLAVLAAVPDASSVAVDIKTVAEPSVTASEFEQRDQPGSASAGAEPAGAAAPRFPIDGELQKHLKRTDSATGQPLSVSGFSTQAVLSSHAALAEVWALRRLADRYPPGREHLLEPASRRQLHAMVEEHLHALRLHLTDYQALVAPVFSQVAAEIGNAPRSVESLSSDDGSWSVSCKRLFDLVRQIDDLTAGLLTGGKLRERPGEALAEVLASFPRMDTELAHATAAVRQEAAKNKLE